MPGLTRFSTWCASTVTLAVSVCATADAAARKVPAPAHNKQPMAPLPRIINLHLPGEHHALSTPKCATGIVRSTQHPGHLPLAIADRHTNALP